MQVESQFDIEQIKQELQQKVITQVDSVKILPNSVLFKKIMQFPQRYYQKEFKAYYVEKIAKQCNYDCEQDQVSQILNENTLEVKHLFQSLDYEYKESTNPLQEINQWRVCIFQKNNCLFKILSCVNQIFSVVEKLWEQKCYLLDLQFDNLLINSYHQIIILNQQDISVVQAREEVKLKQCMENFARFIFNLFDNCMQYLLRSETNLFITKQIIQLAQSILQQKFNNLSQIKQKLYEITVLSLIHTTKIQNNFEEAFNQFEKQKNICYNSKMDVEFDFKNAKKQEEFSNQNIQQNINVFKNLLILANMYSRYHRNYSQSINYLNKAQFHNPYEIEILLGFILICIQRRNQEFYSIIRKTLQSVSYLVQDNWKIYYYISWLYDRDCKYKKCQYFLQKTKNLNSQDPCVISLEAIFYLCTKQNKLALELIDKAVELNKLSFPIVFFRKGYIEDDLNIKDSQKWYEKSLEVDPFAADLYFNIGYNYSEKEDIDQSIYYYNKCIEIDPNYVNAYLNQENNYSKLQNLEKQVECLLKVIEIDPNNYQAYLNLGVCYEQQQKYAEAVQLWKKSIQINPRNPDAYGLIAYREYNENNFLSSIWNYKKYNQYAKNNENEAYFSLSVLYQQNNDLEEAEINAHIYSKISDNLEAYNNLVNILYEEQELGEEEGEEDQGDGYDEEEESSNYSSSDDEIIYQIL